MCYRNTPSFPGKPCAEAFPVDGKAAHGNIGKVVKRLLTYKGHKIQWKCDLGESGEAETRQAGDF